MHTSHTSTKCRRVRRAGRILWLAVRAYLIRRLLLAITACWTAQAATLPAWADSGKRETFWPASPQRLQLPLGLNFDCNPLEARLLDDAADGELNEHSLLGAALVASGVTDPAELARCQQRFRGLAQQAALETASCRSAAEIAASLHRWMHQNLLQQGYQVDCTDLPELFVTGRFNCVSSTVLFCCLAEAVGLPATATEVPGHVFVHVNDGQGLEVQTTCAGWFELLPASSDDPAAWRKAAGIPEFDAAAARPLSGSALVAAIYYNRGVDRLAQSRFAEALSANYKAHCLDPASAGIRGNLLATINNWALALCEAGEFAQAAELLSQGCQMAPEHASFARNHAALQRRWKGNIQARSASE
jgi:hypothetical protein